jgi:hypothetical protein
MMGTRGTDFSAYVSACGDTTITAKAWTVMTI